MAKTLNETHKEPKILHPMESFGSVHGLAEGIRVNRLENRLHPLVPFPHKHDFFQLIFMKEGTGLHQIDFDVHRAAAGSIFIMQPAQVHNWDLSPDSKGYILEFNTELFQTTDFRLLQMKRILTHLPAAHEMSSASFHPLYQQVADAFGEFERRDEHFELKLWTQILQIIISIAREVEVDADRKSDTPNSALYESFLRLLETHYREDHRVSFYADCLNLTSKALTMRFQRLGLPAPRTLIQERCLLEAKRFLVYSALSIQEIGDTLGFDDPNYFARFFRTHVKMSPGEFRRQSGRLC